MKASTLIRQLHRWVAAAFVLRVLAYMAAMSQGTPPPWLGLFALIPLILLELSGIYLFLLPYAARLRSGPAERAT